MRRGLDLARYFKESCMHTISKSSALISNRRHFPKDYVSNSHPAVMSIPCPARSQAINAHNRSKGCTLKWLGKRVGKERNVAGIRGV